MAGLIALVPEELVHQRRTFDGQYPTLHLRLMIQLRVLKQVDHRAGSAGSGLGSAVDDTAEPRVEHGTAAHGAGLQGDVELAALQPVIAQYMRCSPQRHDRRGGVVWSMARCGRGDDQAVFDNHRAHRHFARTGSILCLRQRSGHKVYVVHLLQKKERVTHCFRG